MTPSDNPPANEVDREHDLKTWPGPFADVKSGRKPFEYRFNDRDYREGDTLRLREWSPETGDYTGETLSRRVGYILHGGLFGIPAGYVIMALTPQPSRPQGEAALRAMDHAANEWADAFYNAVQWIKNIKSGCSLPDSAIQNVERCAEHCQATWAAAKALSNLQQDPRVPPDVARLVVAARIVAHEDQGAESLKELDQASEAFASRVWWEGEPDEPALSNQGKPSS